MLVLDLITDYVNKLTFFTGLCWNHNPVLRFIYISFSIGNSFYSYQIQFIIFHIGKFML